MDMVSFDFLIEIGYSVHISTEIDSCQALLIRERLLACKKIHAIKLNSHDFISTDNEDVPVSFLSSEIIFGILTKNVQEKAATVDIPGLYGSTFSRKIKERSEFILKECVHAEEDLMRPVSERVAWLSARSAHHEDELGGGGEQFSPTSQQYDEGKTNKPELFPIQFPETHPHQHTNNNGSSNAFDLAPIQELSSVDETVTPTVTGSSSSKKTTPRKPTVLTDVDIFGGSSTISSDPFGNNNHNQYNNNGFETVPVENDVFAQAPPPAVPVPPPVTRTASKDEQQHHLKQLNKKNSFQKSNLSIAVEQTEPSASIISPFRVPVMNAEDLFAQQTIATGPSSSGSMVDSEASQLQKDDFETKKLSPHPSAADLFGLPPITTTTTATSHDVLMKDEKKKTSPLPVAADLFGGPPSTTSAEIGAPFGGGGGSHQQLSNKQPVQSKKPVIASAPAADLFGGPSSSSSDFPAPVASFGPPPTTTTTTSSRINDNNMTRKPKETVAMAPPDDLFGGGPGQNQNPFDSLPSPTSKAAQFTKPPTATTAPPRVIPKNVVSSSSSGTVGNPFESVGSATAASFDQLPPTSPRQPQQPLHHSPAADVFGSSDHQPRPPHPISSVDSFEGTVQVTVTHLPPAQQPAAVVPTLSRSMSADMNAMNNNSNQSIASTNINTNSAHNKSFTANPSTSGKTFKGKVAVVGASPFDSAAPSPFGGVAGGGSSSLFPQTASDPFSAIPAPAVVGSFSSPSGGQRKTAATTTGSKDAAASLFQSAPPRTTGSTTTGKHPASLAVPLPSNVKSASNTNDFFSQAPPPSLPRAVSGRVAGGGGAADIFGASAPVSSPGGHYNQGSPIPTAPGVKAPPAFPPVAPGVVIPPAPTSQEGNNNTESSQAALGRPKSVSNIKPPMKPKSHMSMALNAQGIPTPHGVVSPPVSQSSSSVPVLGNEMKPAPVVPMNTGKQPLIHGEKLSNMLFSVEQLSPEAKAAKEEVKQQQQPSFEPSSTSVSSKAVFRGRYIKPAGTVVSFGFGGKFVLMRPDVNICPPTYTSVGQLTDDRSLRLVLFLFVIIF
jgi:hypothetical protein